MTHPQTFSCPLPRLTLAAVMTLGLLIGLPIGGCGGQPDTSTAPDASPHRRVSEPSAEPEGGAAESSSDREYQAADAMFVAPDPTPMMEAAPSPEPNAAPRMQSRSLSANATAPSATTAPSALTAPSTTTAPSALTAPSATFPAGTQVDPQQGFATVQVFYATDRQRGALPLSALELHGHPQLFWLLCGGSLLLLSVSVVQGLRGRARSSAVAVSLAALSGSAALALLWCGQTRIEKHGVTYSAERGTLARGVCEVTVPNSHRRGQVERPSLLRFEFREDQDKHIVLTSAVELSHSDFQQRLSGAVAGSPARDLLVFIHGYNVRFEAAVQRTAQIAVDLPFEGVPVCYSWPSQGTLLGYPIDENNVEWSAAHLTEFLRELAAESGADSINVVAHSMGNRALSAALQQIRWQLPEGSPAPFDRIVLAAPDVDADRFRRDFAPALLQVANQVTLYASSSDQALIASKQVHGYPRAGDSGENLVVVPGVETIDVSGIDLSLLGHSYYGDNESMLRDLYQVIQSRLPAPQRPHLLRRLYGAEIYWQLAQQPGVAAPLSTVR